MSENTLYIDNSNRLVLEGLQDEDSGAYLNAATVVATLYDENDVEVVGQTWPLNLSYVAASNGDYRGTLDYDLQLTEDALYYAHITATSGSLQGSWRIALRADYRRS